MNPLFAAVNQPGPAGNLMDRIRQFQKTINGDPRDLVQQMLNSGRISQQQYNQAAQMATQIQRTITGK